MPFDPHKIRKEFPVFSRQPELHYLDSAATALKPSTVIQAMAEFDAYHYAPVHRSVYKLAEQATERYENVRHQTAAWLNVLQSEIFFTHGTTESINIVAQSWAFYNLKEGDEIVFSPLEHHANMLPWLSLAKQRNLTVRWLMLAADGTLRLDNLATIITSKTKLVAITHSSNVLGTLVDVQTIARYAHVQGARVLIDAAQTAAREKLEPATLGADFLVFSPHKMGGPTGLGILYITKELHETFAPYQWGGAMIANVSAHVFHPKPLPEGLMGGTPPISQVIGFGATLSFLQAIDLQALRHHETQLCKQLIEGLRQYAHVAILGPQEQLMQSGHMVSFVVKGMHAHDVAAALDMDHICVRAGHHCAQPLHRQLGIAASVRASFWAYTIPDEIATLIKKVGELV